MIRLASTNDLEAIYKLGMVFHENFYKTYNVEEYLKNDNYIIIVNDDKNINAFMIVYKNIDYFELEAIIVDPKYRKKGIASNLMDFFIKNYTKTNDSILLEVAVNNEAAINLYKRFNFGIINIRKKYYHEIDAYVMKMVI